MTRRFACGALVWTVLASAAPAAEAAPPLDCRDGGATAGDMQACAERSFAEADRALNEAYADALKRIGTVADVPDEDRVLGRDSLRAAQKAWIAFREKDCDEAAAWGWNHSFDRITAGLRCAAELSKERTATLKRRYGSS